MTPEGLGLLRKPFPAESIGKLPRVTCPACSKKNCSEHQKKKCPTCNAYVSVAHIHLDYVGHAAVTDRLLSVDPEWTWEPFGVDAQGLPAISTSGSEASLWIRLTILGVTRPAVGTAPAGSFELPKQLISDAIRNGAMRFGVALDLWSKEDLGHDDGESSATPAAASSPPTPADNGASAPSLEATATATAAARSIPSEARPAFAAFLRETGIASTPSMWTDDHARRVVEWCETLPLGDGAPVS